MNCMNQMVHKMTTSIGSKRELIENSFDICTIKFKLDIFEFLYSWPNRCHYFMAQMSMEFSISSCFEPKDVITLRTIWWPQLHSTYQWPQVLNSLYEISVALYGIMVFDSLGLPSHPLSIREIKTFATAKANFSALTSIWISRTLLHLSLDRVTSSGWKTFTQLLKVAKYSLQF